MSALSRRNLLRSLPLGFAAAALPAVVDVPLQADLTAIPWDMVDAIIAWQAAYRANVRAANAYSASLRVKPLNKAECDRCFAAYVATCEAVGPAREAMLAALGRV